MSQYGREYRLEWLQSNVKSGISGTDISGRQIRVSIFQTSFIIGDLEVPEVIPMTAASEPLIVDILDNERNKYTPIKAKQATITFKSNTTQQQVIDTFCDWPDNEWYVEITDNATGVFILKGFLMLSDMQGLLFPDPTIVSLVVSDHLGSLREKPLVDSSGLTPEGKYRIAELLSMCLKQTGLSLNIKVVNNLRHGGGQLTNSCVFSFAGQYIVTSGLLTNFFYVGQQIVITGTASNNGTRIVTAVDNTGLVTQVTINAAIVSEVATATFTDSSSQSHLYEKIYLDAKTFEKEIGESEDCYEVLTKILGYDCFLTQYEGAWWIYRVDEFDDNGTYIASFDPDGSLDSIGGNTPIVMDIGREEDVKFVNANNLMMPDRPYKSVRLNYSFEYPKEIVCNIDFTRGDVDDDSNPLDITYLLECWTLYEGVPGYYGTVDGTTARIHRIFDTLSYEIEKYIVLTPRTTFETSTINAATYIQSQAIPIEEQDRFTVSVDYKLTDNSVGIATKRLLRLVLNGNDGSWWILGEDSVGDGIPVWYDTSLWTTNSAKGGVDVDFESDNWNTISWEAPAAPVTGNLYIWLNQLNQNSAVYDSHDIKYSNLRFVYDPYINGTYQKFSGQYNQVTRADEPDKYNAKLEDRVYISDAKKVLQKGCMFISHDGGTTFYRAQIYYSAAQFSLGYPPDDSYLHPFGWHQIQAVWNQHRWNTRFFESSVLGLGENWPDVVYKYSLTDSNPNTNNRYFILISYSQNWKNQVWDAVFAECFRTDEGRVYTDDFIFKLITSE